MSWTRYAANFRPIILSRSSCRYPDRYMNERHYNVLCSIARRDQQDASGSMLILYFIDTTELVRLKQTYADEKIVAGIFVIDNYDDLMQSMEDPVKPQMLAEIDKRVVQWMSFTNGIIKNTRETNICSFSNRST